MEFAYQMLLNVEYADKFFEEFTSFISDIWWYGDPILRIISILVGILIGGAILRSVVSKVAAAIIAAA